jgi:hypothetical protein
MALFRNLGVSLSRRWRDATYDAYVSAQPLDFLDLVPPKAGLISDLET